ncbi:MAG TPA: serine hydrolase [Thermoanaerobaculia bacterium]|nr:serine hydrolase [Thermoanaerobaculia bacterium]
MTLDSGGPDDPPVPATRVALRALAVALLLLVLAASSGEAHDSLPPDLDAYAARTLKAFEVPGMAVAVVKDGKVVMARGYGVRELGKAPPVDANTLFGIASNSKAFTSAVLAMLVDDGRIAWDDPVIQYLPAFQMYDPWVTREMTIRDLLAHHSGLGPNAGDLMSFPPTTFSRDEIVRRLRFLRPVTSFRSRYAYDNVLYLVAGEVVRAVTGRTWDECVKERIFAPLGMTRSNTSIEALRSADDVATPHSRVAGRVTPIEYMNIDNVAPAGAINSCAGDMAKWMIAQLGHGSIRGAAGERRLFSERQSREMWSPQTIIPIDDLPPPLAALRPAFLADGLGWFLRDFRGHKMVWHTGGISGMVSRVTLIPDQNVGIAVFTNQQDDGAFQAMTYHILDRYLGFPETDWIDAFRAAGEAARRNADEAVNRRSRTRAVDSKPSLPLPNYAGTYRDAWYGNVTITEEHGGLVLRFSRTPLLVGDLEHWQYDTFVARWRDRRLNADAFVTFALTPDGSIDQMKMQPISPSSDIRCDFQDLLFVPAGRDGKPPS